MSRLANMQVNPQFYAFRWITLLLTQEFSFPDSVRLWDTLFSDEAGRYDCLLRFCCAMLINVREELLKVSVPNIMGFLQIKRKNPGEELGQRGGVALDPGPRYSQSCILIQLFASAPSGQWILQKGGG